MSSSTRRAAASLGSASLLLALAIPAQARPPSSTRSERQQQAWKLHRELLERSPLRGLAWRNIGPVSQGGRLVDIEVVSGSPYTFYVAYASGGLWKTTTNGMTFTPLFDEQPTLVMGDVALDPSHPDTLWVGTGENNSSRSSYGGAGVFRSEDGGLHWTPRGLEESDRIGRISVDPRDGDRVLVGALGPLYTDGGQRGVYQTRDGGETWEQVLPGDARTGCVDLARDPADPDVVYAALWQRFRRPWDFEECGPGSGLWKSTDGGDTWTRLGGGFPQGEKVGRIGLALSPSQPSTVYALLDNQELLPEDQWDLGDGTVTAKRLRGMTREEFLAQDPEEVEDFLRGYDLDPRLDAAALREKVKEGEITVEDLLKACTDANSALFQTDVRGCEVWRSDDGGATWRRTHEEPLRDVFYTYGYYFGQIRVHPRDPEVVYVLGVPLLRSSDGGKTFEGCNAPELHVDHQALWIDPEFPDRLISGNDGGLNTSFDGGRTWWKLNEIPVGQLYTIAVDMEEPYHVYAGLQDNGILEGPSTWQLGISDPWRFVGGGDGMHVQVDPRDSGTVYYGSQFGSYYRRDSRGRHRITPRNALEEAALRYNWNSPICLSSHDPDTLYFGANRVYRSLDRGETWTPLSDDLTSSSERGDVPYATVTTLGESPLEFGLLWAGTDDGHVWVTEDGGHSWRNVTGPLPSHWVSRVAPSPHERDTAFVTLNGYREDDPTPWLYRTTDLGRTWEPRAAGLPEAPLNVVRQDPFNAKVLYAGSDRGVYVSLDGGESWEACGSGLPAVPVHDLLVHPRQREVVIATHGRSAFVLDALPIEELEEALSDATVHVFPLEEEDYRRSFRNRRNPWFERPGLDPELRIPFAVKDAGSVEFQLLDEQGRLLRRDALDATEGVNEYFFDLLLDTELALAAEDAAAREKEAEDAEKKAEASPEPGKDGQDARGQEEAEEVAVDEEVEGGEEEDVQTQPVTRRRALELGRRLYVEPGKYTVRFVAGEAHADTELEVKAPEPREPRVKPKPKARGEK